MQSSAQDGPVFHMCVTMCACGAGCIVASSLLIFAGLLDCTLDRSVLGVYQTLLQGREVVLCLPSRLFGCLLVPEISREFHKASMTHFTGTGIFISGLISTGGIVRSKRMSRAGSFSGPGFVNRSRCCRGRHFTYCLGDYLGCVKDEIATELIETFTWETGIGLGAVFAPSMAFHGDSAPECNRDIGILPSRGDVFPCCNCIMGLSSSVYLR